MTPQTSLTPTTSAYPSLDPVLMGTPLKVEIEQAVRLSLVVALQLVHAASRIDLPLVIETEPTPLAPRVLEVLRANLQSAAQHAALDHESLTFRDCSRPMCRDAANLVAYPMPPEPGATEADRDVIFQREMALLAVDAPEAAEAQWGPTLSALVVQDRVGPLFEQFWADLTQLRLN